MSLLAASGIWAAPPGGEPVVRGISLEIGRGEWLALSGPNGGGKTTLALALAGLRPIQRGHITMDPALAEGPHDHRRVAVILQDPSAQLFASTVGEELGYTARNLSAESSAIDQGVERWAQRLGLGDDLASDPRSLSAGRQQLVLLAAALISRPLLLIADEPGAHLDDRSRERVLEAIRSEVSSGLAVIWLTQARREIEAADRLIWIGESLAQGTGPEATSRAQAAASTLPGEAAASVRIRPSSGQRGPLIRTEAAIEFSVASRGVLALLGPNAAGKSVLLGALAGLEETEQVQIRWRDSQGPPPLLVSQYPERQIFQELVRDELAYAAVSRGMDRAAVLAEAARCLERLGFRPGTLESRCWDLSSGERRLIEVLAGLIAPARLIALDEPTAGLDSARRAALAALIRERAARGRIVLASQDRPWAEGLAESILELGQGADKCLPSLSKKTD
jgi:energy-coupling factor transport system ATP-binding protein